MTAYTFGLFTHLLIVMVAFGASTLLHSYLVRLHRADTVSDALGAMAGLRRLAPRMPIFAFLLVLSGSLLTRDRWPWNTPFIEVGILGVVVMVLVSGIFLKPRMARLGGLLAQTKDGPLPGEAVALLQDRVLWTASNMPTSVALGVMFVMVAKQSLAFSLAAVGVFVVAGVLAAVPFWRRPVTVGATQAA